VKWSFKIGRIFGIDVFMHVTFGLLLLWVGVSYYQARQSWADVAAGLVFILTLFAIVVMHELGHALTARRFGIRTRDITLLPIGGVARLEKMPEEPRQELLVAVAGPAVNVALALVLGGLLAATTGAVALDELSLVGGSFLAKLVAVNVMLAVFNMIPAFPMDGGRVLRALLAMRMDYVHATQVAAAVGQAIAFLFAFLGLFTNPFLVFIALFVWIGAASEASFVQMKASLSGIPVRGAMVTRFRTLAPTDTLRDAAEHLLAGFQQDFPVLEDGRLVGVLTRNDLMRDLAEGGGAAAVAHAMHTTFETADPGDMLEPAMERLQQGDCGAMPVVRDGEVVGVLTRDNLGELLMIQAAARKAARP